MLSSLIVCACMALCGFVGGETPSDSAFVVQPSAFDSAASLRSGASADSGDLFATDRPLRGKDALFEFFDFLIVYGGVWLGTLLILRGVRGLASRGRQESRDKSQEPEEGKEMHEAMRGAAEDLKGTFVSASAIEAPLVGVCAYQQARAICAKPVGAWSGCEVRFMMTYIDRVMNRSFPGGVRYSLVLVGDADCLASGNVPPDVAASAYKHAMQMMALQRPVARFHHGKKPVMGAG